MGLNQNYSKYFSREGLKCKDKENTESWIDPNNLNKFPFGRRI